MFLQKINEPTYFSLSCVRTHQDYHSSFSHCGFQTYQSKPSAKLEDWKFEIMFLSLKGISSNNLLTLNNVSSIGSLRLLIAIVLELIVGIKYNLIHWPAWI